MRHVFQLLVGLILAVTLGACSATMPASRSAMPDDTMLGFAPPDVRVESFTVSVPRSLKVNERNRYYPQGDIVWRGEPMGDRHAQVKAIFEAGLRGAASQVEGSRPVRMDIRSRASTRCRKKRDSRWAVCTISTSSTG
jgi:hypothetical protein